MRKFISTCSKVETTEEELEYITNYIDGASETILDTIIEVSQREALLPIVYRKVKSLPVECDYLLSKLRVSYLYTVQKNMLLASQLIELTAILEENGIDCISIKGVTLARLAYGDITLRQFGDIDILVKKSQLQDADKVLRKHGYQALYRDGILTNDICLEKLIDIGYTYDQTTIEVHWRLLETKHNGDKTLNDPFDSTQTVSIDSTTLCTLSSELLLVYITLHGAKHAWDRLGWICDIDRLARRGDIEWQRCIEVASESKIQRAFYLGLHISQHLYDTPLPDKILRFIQQTNISDIALSTIDRFDKQAIARSPMSKREIFLYQIRLFGSRRKQIYFLLETIFTISPADCIRFAIPDRWRFAYLLLRPYRLAKKVLFG